jgi:hypothetical protein
MATETLGLVMLFWGSALALLVPRVVVHQDALRSGATMETTALEEYGSFSENT